MGLNIWGDRSSPVQQQDCKVHFNVAYPTPAVGFYRGFIILGFDSKWDSERKREGHGYFRGYWKVLATVCVVQSIEDFFVFFGDEKIFSATASFQFRPTSESNLPSSSSKVLLFSCIFFFFYHLFLCDLMLMFIPIRSEFDWLWKVGPTRAELSTTRPLRNRFRLPGLQAPKRSHHLYWRYLAPSVSLKALC